MAGKISNATRNLTGAFRARITAPSGTPREAQIYAAVLLPFFIVFSIVVAKVANNLLLEIIPDTIAALSALRFLLGSIILILTGAAWIIWVRTGGFGLFA